MDNYKEKLKEIIDRLTEEEAQKICEILDSLSQISPETEA